MKRKVSPSAGELNPDHPACSLVTMLNGLFQITESSTEFMQEMQDGIHAVLLVVMFLHC